MAVCATILLMLCLILLYGCHNSNCKTIVDSSIDCDSAAAHILDTGCTDMLTISGADEIPYTADDMPWNQYCRQMQDSGIIVLDLDCVLSVDTCEQIEVCLD